MTHDELLAALAYTPHTDPNGDKMHKALRAIVELHKPFEIDREGNCNCQECEWDYPCPTIQAIEKELG